MNVIIEDLILSTVSLGQSPKEDCDLGQLHFLICYLQREKEKNILFRLF